MHKRAWFGTFKPRVLNRAFFCAVQAPAKQLHAFAERQLQPLTQVCRCNAVAFQNEFDAAV
eukprot:7033418-Pyramimonas_sp.AAC.1